MIRSLFIRCSQRSLSTSFPYSSINKTGLTSYLQKIRENLDQAAFKHFDKNGNGLISPEEFTQVVEQELKLGMSKTEISELIKKIDTDSSGQIDYNEFFEGRHLLEEKKVLSKLNGFYLGPESFRIFDADGSGSVDVDEFLTVLRNMGVKLSEEEAVELVKLVDTDGSGDVDYEEFMEVMNNQ